MTLKEWESKTLAAPGAAQRVGAATDKLRAAVELPERHAAGCEVCNGDRGGKYWQCQECGFHYYTNGKRGRPPKRCAPCKDNTPRATNPEADAEIRRRKARETVDRLEMMLRSRGSHISQNRD